MSPSGFWNWQAFINYIKTGDKKMGERQRKLYEVIADKLLNQIQRGIFKPGDKLPAERTLAQEYGVNRAVIREAFRSMERMGCVDSKVGGGTYVTVPEVSDITDPLSILLSQSADPDEELLETRLILETAIVRLAAVRRAEDQLEQLHRNLQDMQIAILRKEDIVSYDKQFHGILAEAANNHSLAAIVALCSDAFQKCMKITNKMEHIPQITFKQHAQILNAVELQDAEAAESAMADHLQSALGNLLKAKK